jgi:EAL domain-containing protein (putative c-di-GMP-specific phosphodiesterase class I)
VSGYGSLIRWQDPEHGMSPPGDFILLAEVTGLIVPIGRWVIQTASRQLRRPGLRSMSCKAVISEGSGAQ